METKFVFKKKKRIDRKNCLTLINENFYYFKTNEKIIIKYKYRKCVKSSKQLNNYCFSNCFKYNKTFGSNRSTVNMNSLKFVINLLKYIKKNNRKLYKYFYEM